jgi:hypothetical protein
MCLLPASFYLLQYRDLLASGGAMKVHNYSVIAGEGSVDFCLPVGPCKN